MLRKFLAVFIIVFSALYSDQTEFPQIIDFGKFNLRESYYSGQSNTWNWQLGEAGYEIGLTAFNEAPELGAFFAFLKKAYHIDTVIETGTYYGATTHFFSNWFNEVHSIEIVEALYNRAKEIFKDQPHVHCHLGSSEKVLSEILPSLRDKTIVFYLDAHWGNYWPLADELEEISKTHKDNCVIVIDDFKVPGRNDLEFDAYQINGVHYECSYDFIKSQIDKVFTEYSVHYIIPKNITPRAKFVAIPKKLAARS